MDNLSVSMKSIGNSVGGLSQHGMSKPGMASADVADGAEFRAALEQRMHANAAQRPPSVEQSLRVNENSLGEKMMTRAHNLAGEIKKDQLYVSRMLEQASRNADSIGLMKAMMALNDYQLRVQFISKTASKATSSLDQLTKLQ